MSDNKAVFLEGKRVILRPYQESTDLGSMLRWMNDQETQQFLGRPPFPLTEKAERDAVERMSERPNDIFLVIIDKESGRAIGTTGLHQINHLNGTGITGTLIGEKEFWGKGLGTEAKMLVLHHAFVRLNLRRIGASVLSINPRSLACMKKCGYKECGKREEWIWRNGQFVDEIFTLVTREDFLPIWDAFIDQ